MDRGSLAALAVVAALAGAAMYFMHASYESQIADLRRQLEYAKAREAEAAAAAVREAKAMAEQAAAERAAAEKAAARARASAQWLASQKAAAEKRLAEAQAAASQARQRADEARQRADEARARAEWMAAKASAASAAPGSAESLYAEAFALERDGRGTDAVKMYVRAARSGSGKAALRLGEIYDKGIAGVSRDYAESLKWYNAARVLGEDVPMRRP